MSHLRLALSGLPGCGKGTMASWIHRDFPSVRVVTAGQLLRLVAGWATSDFSTTIPTSLVRWDVDKAKEVARAAASSIETGALVSDELMEAIVVGSLEGDDDGTGSPLGNAMLLDGFPRTEHQAVALQASRRPLHRLIHIDVDPVHIWETRIRGRRVHEPSGRTYHTDFAPPKRPGVDDVTGEPLTRRPDDRKEVVFHRFEVYKKEMGPVFDLYKAAGLLRHVPSPSSPIGYEKVRAIVKEDLDAMHVRLEREQREQGNILDRKTL
uniref:Adenylate kinase active site lid domain-containing protein n=1 Tax=Sexangularia sp. CB-2014 TaxID=1486929 RepID=A0A7S1VN17_9EUKA